MAAAPAAPPGKMLAGGAEEFNILILLFQYFVILEHFIFTISTIEHQMLNMLNKNVKSVLSNCLS